jgi:hypothetical protein
MPFIVLKFKNFWRCENQIKGVAHTEQALYHWATYLVPILVDTPINYKKKFTVKLSPFLL